MTARCVEISRVQADLTQAHIRIERAVALGRCSVAGRVAHPDILGLTELPSETFRSRALAIKAAVDLAQAFGVSDVWLIV